MAETTKIAAPKSGGELEVMVRRFTGPSVTGVRALHLTTTLVAWGKTSSKVLLLMVQRSGRPVDMVNIPKLSESLSCVYVYLYIYYDICISTGDRRISLYCRGSHERREFFLESPLNHRDS